MYASPLPVYNRYAILAEGDPRQQMTTWTDFLKKPVPPEDVAAVGPPRKPVPLHERPPVMEPMEAQHQLRADMSAACADMRKSQTGRTMSWASS